MLNFVIFREARGFFSLFSILSKIVHFVTCEKWTSNYEIRISILYVHYVLWYIKLFCQKGLILSFCESAVDFFDSSILSKMLHFVILWDARVFFRVFNFVKNTPFCHCVRGPWIFTLIEFCQKCSILSFCERTVECFDSSILSKTLNFVIFREAFGFFSLFQVCQKLSILSFVKSGLQISILSKIVHFVICEKWTSNYEISISILCVHYVLWYIKLFCQKGSILSLSERPV